MIILTYMYLKCHETRAKTVVDLIPSWMSYGEVTSKILDSILLRWVVGVERWGGWGGEMAWDTQKLDWTALFLGGKCATLYRT
jgi:hypothetical protein